MKSIYKLLIDIGPLAIFISILVVVYKAILPLMIATVIAVIISYVLEEKFQLWQPWVTSPNFLSLTIYFNDEIFIKMKPTIINAVFAIILYSGVLLKKPLLKYLLGAALKLEEEVGEY